MIATKPSPETRRTLETVLGGDNRVMHDKPDVPPPVGGGTFANGYVMHKLLAVLVLGCVLSACAQVHGVSTAGSTNVGGAPGTANDLATGGQGGRTGNEGGGGGGGSGRN